MEEMLKASGSPSVPRKRPSLARAAAEENGPIVISCKEAVRRNRRKLEIEVGLRHYKKEHRQNYFSVVITRFHISADFTSGSVEYAEPKNSLSATLAEVTSRDSASRESESNFGPELSGNVFKALASLKSKRAQQTQQELKRGVKVVEILTAEPGAQPHSVTWLVKLHSPLALAKFLNGTEKGAESVLDYYTGVERLLAKAVVDSPTSHTSVSVTVDCDHIFFFKHRTDSRFSAFWESVILFESSAKRTLKRMYGGYQGRAFIECTLR